MKGSCTLRSNLKGREFLVPLIVTRLGLGILFGDFAFRDTLFSSPLSLCASPKSLEYPFTALFFSLLCFLLFLTVNRAVNSKGCGPSLVCVYVCVCVQLPLQVGYVGMYVQMQKWVRYVCMCVQLYLCVFMCVQIHLCVCPCMYRYICVWGAYACKYKCTCVWGMYAMCV